MCILINIEYLLIKTQGPTNACSNARNGDDDDINDNEGDLDDDGLDHWTHEEVLFKIRNKCNRHYRNSNSI